MGLSNSKTNRNMLHGMLAVMMALGLLSLVCPAGAGVGSDWSYSDANHDGIIDSPDLLILASNWLGSGCDMHPAWCNYSDVNRDGEVNFADFSKVARNWKRRTFTVKHSNNTPTRLAYGPDESLYVTDNAAGSVFIYDPNMILVSELKKLKKPLGIAVADSGNIYVGSDGNNCVEVYDPNGFHVKDIGSGVTKMPNDLAFDDDGNLYVLDSKSNTVRVYDTNDTQIRTIDDGDLKFPVAIEIAYKIDGTGELFVADQGNYKIKVFGLDGTFLRSFGSIVTQSMMGGWKWTGKFINMQSLAVDSNGWLYVLDSYLKKVQILDATTGAYKNNFGEGLINLGQDIAIRSDGKVFVTDTFNHSVTKIYTGPYSAP